MDLVFACVCVLFVPFMLCVRIFAELIRCRSPYFDDDGIQARTILYKTCVI